MTKQNFYTTEDLANILNYSTHHTMLFSLKNSGKDSISYDIWNKAKLPKKLGKNFIFDKSKVDKILKEYGICQN